MKKETETKKRNNDFWLYEMLAIGLVVFLMALYFLFMLFEWGFKKAGLRKIANDIEALNYKVLVKILFYLKMRQ